MTLVGTTGFKPDGGLCVNASGGSIPSPSHQTQYTIIGLSPLGIIEPITHA